MSLGMSLEILSFNEQLLQHVLLLRTLEITPLLVDNDQLDLICFFELCELINVILVNIMSRDHYTRKSGNL